MARIVGNLIGVGSLNLRPRNDAKVFIAFLIKLHLESAAIIRGALSEGILKGKKTEP